MKKWEIQYISFANTEKLDVLLKDGWEPFAVTCLGNVEYAIIWLRKETENAPFIRS